jgi:hypothetical protein
MRGRWSKAERESSCLPACLPGGEIEATQPTERAAENNQPGLCLLLISTLSLGFNPAERMR